MPFFFNSTILYDLYFVFFFFFLSFFFRFKKHDTLSKFQFFFLSNNFVQFNNFIIKRSGRWKKNNDTRNRHARLKTWSNLMKL